MSIPAAIGIDLGSQNTVIGCAKKGGVEIITNEGSHRETPVVVGYGPNERFIGEQGAVQLKSNFKNTVIYPLRFLGMKGNSPHLDYESKFIYNKLTTLPDGRIGFSVTHQGENRIFLPEQVVATMLQKLKEIVHKNGIGHSDFVLSAPSYFTEQERRALLDAAKLAGVNVVRLINEHTAIALGYGIFKKAELDSNPKNVLFVDIGHSSTSIFLASFTKEKVTILDQSHERTLGARDFDWTLLEFYANMFNKANGLNPMKNEKARLRLLEAVEKQRKILSANTEAGINIEYLMEDYDLNHMLTRDQFEQLISPLVSKLKATISKINLAKYPIDSVEIVGGATRIPIVQRTIQELCGKSLSRTQNATECIARGAALQAAILSPLFKVADYIVEDSQYYPIHCSWKFFENTQTAKQNTTMDIEDHRNNLPKQKATLFDYGCSVPSVKSINFHREDAVEVKLFYDPVPYGAEEQIATYLIEKTKPTIQDFKVKFKVQLNRNGVIEFENSQLIEEVEEEELQQVEGSGDQLQKKKRNKITDIKTEVLFRHGLHQNQIKQFFEEECHMANSDRLILETYHQKNVLESYIYDTRGKLNERYKGYADPSVIDGFLQKLTDCEEWLYGDGAKTKKEAYINKLDELRGIEESIQKKFLGNGSGNNGDVKMEEERSMNKPDARLEVEESA